MKTGLAGILLVLAAQAQDYSLIRIAGGRRPDGRGFFNLNALGRPAIEGTRVALTTVQADASLWSCDLASGEYVKLADVNTPAPGGTGNFADFAMFDSKPLLSGGTVVFLATDAKGRPNQGLYAVPAAGGAVTRIANYNSSGPGGLAFGDLDASFRQPFGGFAVHAGKAVFTVTYTNGQPAIYSANLDGSGLTRVADTSVRYIPPGLGPPFNEVYQWWNPWVRGDRTVFYGQTIQDSSQGYHGIYTLGVSGGGTPAEILNSRTAMPGNSNPGGRTRIVFPGLQMDDEVVAFIADDPSTGGQRRFRGLYTIPRAGGAVRRIADINTTVPGLGALSAESFNSYTLNEGRILFRVVDVAGAQALLLWRNGQITKVIQTGELYNGRPLRSLEIGAQAMSGERMVFLASTTGELAILAAVPASGTRVTGVQNAASYTSEVVAPGGIVTVYGEEIGPAELRLFQFDARGRIPAALGGTQILFNGIPAPVLFTSASVVGAIAPFPLESVTSAEVVAQYRDRASAPRRVTVRVDPGLFSANSSGSGPGAILNEDGSVNSPENPAARGSIVVLFGAGFGQTNPEMEEGTITSGPTLPRLRNTVFVTVGGQAATVLYSGAAPGSVAGLYQFNIRLPETVGGGNLPVRVTTGGFSTQEGLTVAVGN